MTTNKHFRNYKIKAFINLGAATLFTLLSLSFHADISLLAFPLALIYTGVTIYFTLNIQDYAIILMAFLKILLRVI